MLRQRDKELEISLSQEKKKRKKRKEIQLNWLLLTRSETASSLHCGLCTAPTMLAEVTTTTQKRREHHLAQLQGHTGLVAGC